MNDRPWQIPNISWNICLTIFLVGHDFYWQEWISWPWPLSDDLGKPDMHNTSVDNSYQSYITNYLYSSCYVYNYKLTDHYCFFYIIVLWPIHDYGNPLIYRSWPEVVCD